MGLYHFYTLTAIKALRNAPVCSDFRDSRIFTALCFLVIFAVFVELMTTLYFCYAGEDTFDSKGAIIHPGEKMSLNPASEYHINSIIGGRGTCGETELPWILYTGDLEEGTGARFSHKRNAKSELLGVHNFTTTIKW